MKEIGWSLVVRESPSKIAETTLFTGADNVDAESRNVLLSCVWVDRSRWKNMFLLPLGDCTK